MDPESLDRKVVHFRLCGQWFHQTLAEFAEALGIFEAPDMDSLGGGILNEWYDLPTTERKAYWDTIVPEWFRGYKKNTRATKFEDPRVRTLHRLIAWTVNGRQEAAGSVNLTDLHIMHALLTRRRLSPVIVLGRYFREAAGRQPNSYICGGNYVTRLADRLGLLTVDVEGRLTEGPPHEYLTVDTLMHMGMVVHAGDRYYLVRTGTVAEEYVLGMPAVRVVEQREDGAQEEAAAEDGPAAGPAAQVEAEIPEAGRAPSPPPVHAEQPPPADDRLARIEERLARIEERHTQVEERLTAIDEHLDAVDVEMMSITNLCHQILARLPQQP